MIKMHEDENTDKCSAQSNSSNPIKENKKKQKKKRQSKTQI